MQYVVLPFVLHVLALLAHPVIIKMLLSAHLHMPNEKEQVELAKDTDLKIKIILRFCLTLIPAAEDPALPCERYKMHSKFVYSVYLIKRSHF